MDIYRSHGVGGINMMNLSYKLCLWAFSNSGFIPVAIVLSTFGMLIDIGISIIFGSRGNCKIGGYRGD